jgi:Tol biopolymer transport system component
MLSRARVLLSAQLFALVPFIAACAAPSPYRHEKCPIRGAKKADHLIEEGEHHFARLWKLTTGGENAEAYWSFEGDRLTLQHRNTDAGIACDRIYTTRTDAPGLVQVSSGLGTTTCSYFLPGGHEILFASTQGYTQACPPPVDHSQGYVWMLHPEFDIFARDLSTGRERTLVSSWGYDAEATLSSDGSRMVFTSTRSGDPELWTCRPDGTELRQITHAPGYDGGAFFSHDGTKLVFRATAFTPDKEAEEIADFQRLLKEWKVRPRRMELFVCDADGANRRQLTNFCTADKAIASFAPYFTPDDQRILFASNHAATERSFDIWSIGVDGSGLERVTTYEHFDSFPMFSPCGRYLAFSSNRGGKPGETNVFVALWK